VTLDTVPSQALKLATHPGGRIPPGSEGCSSPISGGYSTLVTWHGRLAVLAVDPDTRMATIFDCKTAVQNLYSTSF